MFKLHLWKITQFMHFFKFSSALNVHVLHVYQNKGIVMFPIYILYICKQVNFYLHLPTM